MMSHSLAINCPALFISQLRLEKKSSRKVTARGIGFFLSVFFCELEKNRENCHYPSTSAGSSSMVCIKSHSALFYLFFFCDASADFARIDSSIVKLTVIGKAIQANTVFLYMFLLKMTFENLLEDVFKRYNQPAHG